MNEYFKHCTQCNITKDISCFSIVSKNQNGAIFRRKLCRDCRSSNRRQDYQKNKDKILFQNQIWRQNNLEKKKLIDKEYYQKNKDKILSQNKVPNKRIKNREYKRKYYSLNKEKIKQYPSSKKKKEYSLKSLKLRLKNNVSFKLRLNISKSIRKCLKKQNLSKNNVSFLNFLPYSIQELKNHIEKQFESWMNWNNWGIYKASSWDDNDQNTWTWQIDHIIPQSVLIYHSLNDHNFKKCWDLNNLRPLSAKENCLKSNKLGDYKS